MTDQQQTDTPSPADQPVSVGYGTKMGTAAAAIAVLIPGIGELADATEPLGVPPQTWVISAAVLAGLVVVGRYGQAFIDRWRAGR